MGRVDLTRAQSHLQREAQVRLDLELAKPLGNLQTADGGAPGDSCEILIGGGPDRNECVADDLGDVAAMLGDQVGDLPQVRVQGARELLGAGRAASDRSRGYLGESGDVDEQQRRRKGFR